MTPAHRSPDRPIPTPAQWWAAQTFVLLVLGWLALDGVEDLAIGALLALAGAGIGLWLAPGQGYPWRPLRLLAFIGYFLRESFRGGFDVAWRALHPALPIDPVLHEHAVRAPAGLPRTLFVATLSLLPGTLSVRLSEDGRRLVVHSLTASPEAALTALEARVLRLFPQPDQGQAE